MREFLITKFVCADCVSKIVKPSGWGQTTHYCAPVATGESK